MEATFPSCRFRHNNKIFIAALLQVLLFSSFVIADENCTPLLKNRCEVCHYLTRVCQKVERERSKKYWFGGPKGVWKRTINNMVKQGAKLNEAEKKILVECLSSPKPELLNLCKLDR